MDPRKPISDVEEKEVFNYVNFLEEEEHMLEISGISFSAYNLYNSEEIEKSIPIHISRVTGNPDDTYGTVYDPRLGVISANDACQTCNLVGNNCPGHLGLIKLESPVIHPLYVKEVILILSSICQDCGELLLGDLIKKYKIEEMAPENRLAVLKDLSDGRTCTNKNCISTKKPKRYSVKQTDIERGKIIYKELYKEKGKWKVDQESETPQSAKTIGKIFNYISNEVAHIMGFDISVGAHPRNTILNYIIVPPPCVRTNNIINGRVQNDKMGQQLEDIIKTNHKLAKYKESKNQAKKKEEYTKLVGHVRNIIMKTEANARNKSVTNTIQGKKGFFRKNLLGARTNYSGRSVASHDPYIPFWVVGVPETMAKELSYPITVTNFNKNILTEYLRQGKIVSIDPSRKSVYSIYHGLRMRVDQKIINNYRLTVGDVVNRWLMDGDYVIVNRQPTIHKYGMLGFEVFVLPPGHNTIHVNIMATTPFNLDFDGDELNIHVPQTPEAQEDVRTKMFIKNCVRGGHKNNLYVKLTYKSIESVAALTADGVIIKPELLGLIVGNVGIENTIMVKKWVRRILKNDTAIIKNVLDYYLDDSEFIQELLTKDLDSSVKTDLSDYRKTESSDIIMKKIKDKIPKKFDMGEDKMEFEKGLDLVPTEIMVKIKSDVAEYFRAKKNEDLIEKLVDFGVVPPLEDMPLRIFLNRVVVTGKQLFSLVLPDKFSYQKKNVLIKDGVLLSGVIDKSHIGAISNIISSYYGVEFYSKFLDESFNLLNAWSDFQGLTVGLEDCMLKNPKSQDIIEKKISEIRIEVRDLRSKKTGDPIEDAKIEQKIKDVVSGFTQSAVEIINKEGPGSSLIQMHKSGAKGSIVNYSKIAVGIGQIFTQGGFSKCNISRGTRSSFYQKPGTNQIEDSGFCVNSFIKGANPLETIYVALSGIEGLLGGLTKTPESGDIFRQFRIYLQGIIVHPDGSARDEQDNIIQITYGYDGIDPEHAVVVSAVNQRKQTFTFFHQTASAINFEYTGTPRLLSPIEIETILSKLPVIESSYASASDFLSNNFKYEMKKTLETLKLKPNAIIRFSDEIIMKFKQTRVRVNTRVGSASSEALIGDITQTALDSKKNTGTTKNKLGPLDMLREISSVTKDPKDPKTKVYFNTPNNFSTIFDFIPLLVELSLEKLALTYSDVENPTQFFESNNPNFWYDTYLNINRMKLPQSNWFLRITLNVELMYYYGLTATGVSEKIKSYRGKFNLFECILSPILTEDIVPFGQSTNPIPMKIIYLDIYPDEESYDVMLKELKLKPEKIEKYRISQVFLQSVFMPEMKNLILAGIPNIQGLEVENVSYDFGISSETLLSDGKYRMYIDYAWANYNTLPDTYLEDLLDAVGLKYTKGTTFGNTYYDVISTTPPSKIISAKISDSEDLNADYTKKQQKIQDQLKNQKKLSQAKQVSFIPPSIRNGGDVIFKNYYAMLDGKNLGKLFILNYIDSTRTYGYDLNETYFYFGIGVTRNLIIVRLKELFDNNNIWIDPKHIILYADYMCFHGKPTKTGSYGAGERDIIVKASFGSQMKVIQEAALYGKIDPVKSVPSSTIVGKKLKTYPTTKKERQEQYISDIDKKMLEVGNIMDMLDNFNTSEFEEEFIPDETLGQTTETINLKDVVTLEKEKSEPTEQEKRIMKIKNILPPKPDLPTFILDEKFDYSDIGSDIVLSCPADLEKKEYVKESLDGSSKTIYDPKKV
jgi:DNA-directed RNA polymerase beta' subunit